MPTLLEIFKDELKDVPNVLNQPKMKTMTYDEMNFERCKALDETNALRKQNAILVKALEEIKLCAEDNIKCNKEMAEGRDEEAFNYSNGTFEEFIKTINRALKEKAIKKEINWSLK
tara:strand:+ start:247 stop:594 length:348 start_codon:yes stop_codon:yes gene_type:complete